MNDLEVKKEWEQKLRASFQNSEALTSFMIHTLESFAHRYLNDPKIESQGQVMWLTGREENMGQALKTNHSAIKEGVKSLAKSVPREAKPALVSRVKVEIQELTADKGKILLTAQVNWAHPGHTWDSAEKVEKKKTLTWDDLQDFRKGFPLALEEICDLFL
jgi:hypothetical protein